MGRRMGGDRWRGALHARSSDVVEFPRRPDGFDGLLLGFGVAERAAHTYADRLYGRAGDAGRCPCRAGHVHACQRFFLLGDVCDSPILRTPLARLAPVAGRLGGYRHPLRRNLDFRPRQRLVDGVPAIPDVFHGSPRQRIPDLLVDPSVPAARSAPVPAGRRRLHGDSRRGVVAPDRSSRLGSLRGNSGATAAAIFESRLGLRGRRHDCVRDLRRRHARYQSRGGVSAGHHRLDLGALRIGPAIVGDCEAGRLCVSAGPSGKYDRL